MTKLLSYWPRKDEINRCIKTEAETASDAVLLSVHQETPLSIRNAGSVSKTAATEGDLLDSFLTPDLPEGTLLLAITGASGAGKSHMIRWLAANLERDARAKNMHVIRVPKSANLKAVVELILEPLRGNDRFANARKELEEAVSSVNLEDGAIHFAANLEVALREKAKTFEGMIRENPYRADIRDLKAKLDHAKKLPAYFNDAALSDHFKGKVLPKIVERAIVGKDENDDEKFPQFSIEDLKIPDDIGLGDASRQVRSYYQTVLNRGENDEGYKAAVDVLNTDVVDKAIGNLFRLNQAMGGVTLEEIVLQIRTLLMEEGKELVLLIEDFAALSGIQEILLSVCIQEAVRDGKQVRSPMRTALAVTDGFMPSHDTILTRAKREWIVESNLSSDKEVISRTVSIVGAYLNAARWGEAELIKKFELSRKNEASGLTDWIDVYRDENESVVEADLLKAFGENNGVPLFPYNTNALEKLIDDHLRVGGKLQFNPRKVINHIMREPLMLRDTFEIASFPSEIFSPRSAKASVASWIASKRLGTQIEGRLSQAIIYWGGNPNTPDQLGSINDGVFKAFDLPAPSELGISHEPSSKLEREPRVGRAEPPISIPRPLQPSPAPEVDGFITDWQEKLESWVGGEELSQTPANQLRSAIVSALNQAIDWNAECMKPVPAKQTVIGLPNARGNNQAKLMFAKNTNDSDGRLRRTLLAFLRFEDQGAAWSYPEADEDTALIANALERLIPEYLDMVNDEIPEYVAVLATILARQGQVLGVAPKRVAGRQSIMDAVFVPAPEIKQKNYEPNSAEDRWHRLQIKAVSERKGLQELLASKLGAFQGMGSTVYAIDVARLSLSDAETPKSLSGDLTPEQREHVSNLSLPKLRARAVPLAKELSGLATLVRHELGESFDKQAVFKELRLLADSAEEANVWPSNFQVGKKALINMLERFRDAPLTDVLEKVEPLPEAISEDQIENMIHLLGRTRIEDVNNLKVLITKISLFVKELEGEIKFREQQDTGVSISDLVDENKKTLSDIGSFFTISKDW